ncbi:MAG TPA: CapA family protein [Candidatus Methylomirabilis sp.]|nr:CapA family protein [Candidatus Methylomirabilis sp.]
MASRLKQALTGAIIMGAGAAAGLLLAVPFERAMGETFRIAESVGVSACVPPCPDPDAGAGSRLSGVGSRPPTTEFRDPLSILFIGDIMLDRLVATRVKKAKDPAYPFVGIRDGNGRYFRGQDLVVANLEGPVAAAHASPVKTNDFAFATTSAPLLYRVGIDAVSQANNHALDQGREAAFESKKYLRNAGIVVFGDQVYDDATSSLAYVEKNGWKIALLGFNDTDNRVDLKEAEEAVRRATTTADLVIVYMHWGVEYRATPDSRQTDLAHWFIDRGAHAVIGSHPHWMQSVEVYNGRPIAYSLGNFVFDQDWSSETRYGLAVKLVHDETSSALRLHPVSITRSQPVFLLGKERDKRLKRLANISDATWSEEIKQGTIALSGIE